MRGIIYDCGKTLDLAMSFVQPLYVSGEIRRYKMRGLLSTTTTMATTTTTTMAMMLREECVVFKFVLVDRGSVTLCYVCIVSK